MPDARNDSERLQKLLSLHSDRMLNDEQWRELTSLVSSSAELRKLYFEHMFLHSMMHRMAKLTEPLPRLPEQPLESTVTPVGGRKSTVRGAGSPVLGFLGDVFRAGADFLSRSLVLTLLMAIGLPGIILLILIVDLARHGGGPVAASSRPLAELTKTHQCVWEGEPQAPMAGTALAHGRQLRLREGVAEILFADGARVVLQGPTTVEVRARNSAFLRRGSLAAHCPPAAHGFAVETPVSTIVDLGTDFGVTVGADGTSEAHVFAGRIRVGARTGVGQPAPAAEEFTTGQGVRIRRSADRATLSTDRIAAEPDRFVRRLPSEHRSGLPRPRIVFAHRGRRDPKTEGWRFFWNYAEHAKPVRCRVFRSDDKGTSTWCIQDRAKNDCITYQVLNEQGLTPQLVAEATKKGWVLHACVRVSSADVGESLCFCGYWANGCIWTVRSMMGSDGNQRLQLLGKTSMGADPIIEAPNSRDRYIDYEVRYHPETKDADVYVDGKLAVTGWLRKGPAKNVVHFGTYKEPRCAANFALVEWGILDQ